MIFVFTIILNKPFIPCVYKSFRGYSVHSFWPNLKPVMILQCQRESYLKEFLGKVVSCTAAQLSLKKKQKVSGYEVVTDDTILFPEGGGQPEDYGCIGEIPVLRVFKRGDATIHFTEQPFVCGDEVKITVDWARRFDHMQQHSAQHLITAVAESMLGAATTSWNLGEDMSSIELDTKALSDQQLQELEDVLNEKIRLALPVSVEYFEKDDPKLQQVKTRLELPDGQSGPVRVVSIEGIDRNTCCGTHVKHLGHLQCIKLLYAEQGKKNKTNLFFVAGGRVLKQLGSRVQREQALTAVLKGGPSEHAKLADKLQKTLKLAQKNLLSVSRDLAILEGKRFKELSPRPKYFSFHKKEGDLEFMTLFLNEVNDQEVLFFLTTGDEKGAGQLVLSGRQETLDNIAPRVCEVLDGKGFSKNGRYQAKVNLGKRLQAEDLIKQHMQ